MRAAREERWVAVRLLSRRAAEGVTLTEFKIDYPNGPDNGMIASYRIQGLPTTIIINRDGNITDAILAAIEPREGHLFGVTSDADLKIGNMEILYGFAAGIDCGDAQSLEFVLALRNGKAEEKAHHPVHWVIIYPR